jgi:hypothetical protein
MFSPPLPRDEGIVAFSTIEEASAALRDVDAHYARHARAAREIAETYFDSHQVLGSLIEEAMAPSATVEVAS